MGFSVRGHSVLVPRRAADVIEDMHTMVQSRFQPRPGNPWDMLNIIGEACARADAPHNPKTRPRGATAQPLALPER